MNSLPRAPLPYSPDLQEIYASRFKGKSAYRRKVWRELCSFFRTWIPENAAVLDLGCGHCEFINTVQCGRKFGIDLNPDAGKLASKDVTVFQQDCSVKWELEPGTLDVVFTSNFLEHLPTQDALDRTLRQAHFALAPHGRFIAIGPNIKYLQGAYWDFSDHYLPLTEVSLVEVLTKCGFAIELSRDRFLPYTMSDGKKYPIWMLRAYLNFSIAWRVFGKQFLVVASKR